MADDTELELDEIAKAALMGSAEELIGENAPSAAGGLTELGNAAGNANQNLKETALSLSEIVNRVKQIQESTSVKSFMPQGMSEKAFDRMQVQSLERQAKKLTIEETAGNRGSISYEGTSDKAFEQVVAKRYEYLDMLTRSADNQGSVNYSSMIDKGFERIVANKLEYLDMLTRSANNTGSVSYSDVLDKGFERIVANKFEYLSMLSRSAKNVGSVSYLGTMDKGYSDIVSRKQEAEYEQQMMKDWAEAVRNSIKLEEQRQRDIKKEQTKEAIRGEVAKKDSYDISEPMIRDFRNTFDLFRDMQKYLSNAPEVLQTISEKNLKAEYESLQSKYGKWTETKNSEGEVTGGYWNKGSYRANVEAKAQAIQNAEKVMKSIADRESEAYKVAIEKFNKARDEFVEELKKDSKDMDEGIKAFAEMVNTEIHRNKAHAKDDPVIARNSRRLADDPKYALIRNKEQKEEWRRAIHYSATGNLKDSFTKTVYNQAVGMRQRRGLEGLFSNVGYNYSGTIAAIAGGGVGKAIDDLGRAIIQLGKDSVQAYSQIESIRTNLGIVYGSQAEADQTFGEIAQYSVKSPFGVQTVSEFAVLLKQSGVYASDLMTTLKQIGDVAGGNQAKFGNIANAFAQIEANGKATTRQLRQFATAGIPIYKELAEYLNTTVSDIRIKTAKSQITAGDIEAVFQKMTSQGGTFENAVNIGAKTIAARKQNLEDARQLALSELGKVGVNAFGDGTGDSLYRKILSWEEKYWGFIQNLAYMHNIQEDVKDIKNNRSEIKEIQNTIDYLKSDNKNGQYDQLIKQLTAKIAELGAKYTPSQERAAALTVTKEYQKTLGKNVISNEKRNQYITDESRLQFYKKIKNDDGTYSYEENYDNRYKREITEQEYIDALNKATIATLELSNSISQKEYEEAFSNNRQFEDLANQAIVDSIGSTTAEMIDKYANKNQKSIYNYAVTGKSRYEATDKGKKEAEIKEKSEWDNAEKTYKELIGYFNKDTGNLLDDVTLTLTDWNRILESGILTNTVKLKTAVSDLANDDILTFNGKSESEAKAIREQQSEDWKAIGLNLSQLNNMVSGRDRDLVYPLMNRLSMFNEDNSNTTKNVEWFNNTFKKVADRVEKEGSEELKKAFGSILTKSDVVDRFYSYEEANPDKAGKAYDPLWRRVLSAGLGTDLTLMRKNNMSATDTFNLFKANSQRALSKTITKALVQSGTSVSDITKRFSYDKGQFNTYDGSYRSNWKNTAENLSKFAMSIESATSVTEAYANQIQSEIDSLDETFASALTQVEEGANIYDVNYAEFLGPLAEKLNATEFAAFSVELEKATSAAGNLKDGFIEAYKDLRNKKFEELTNAKIVSGYKSVADEYKTERKGNLVKNAAMRSARYIDSSDYGDVNIEELFEKMLNKRLSAVSKNGVYTEEQVNEQSKKLLDDFNGNTVLVDIVSLQNDISETKQKLEREKKSHEKTLQELESGVDYGSPNVMKNRLYSEENSIRKDSDKLNRLQRELDLIKSTNELSQSFSEAALSARNVKDSLDLLRGAEALDVLAPKKKYGNFSDVNNNLEEKRWERERNHPLFWEFANSYSEEMLGVRAQKGNSISQQYALNYLADATGDKSIAESNFKDLSRGAIGVQPTEIVAGQVTLSSNDQRYQDYTSVVDAFSRETKKNGDNNYREEMLSKVSTDFDVDSFGNISETIDLTAFEQMYEYLAKSQAVTEGMKSQFGQLGKNISSTFRSQAISGAVSSFEIMGKHLRDGSDASEDLGENWRKVGQAMLSQMSQLMINAGLNMVATAGMGNKSQIIAGLALAAAGGCAGILSGMLTNDNEDKNKSDSETEKLEKLKDLLKDLIDQAKEDANYYERNYLHKQALSTNARLTESVNDAIIAPNGKIITTAPDDYLIATKTPETLGARSMSNEVKVNFQVVNNGNANIEVNEVKTKENADGSIDIMAMVVAATGQAIADGSLDGAFNIRDTRLAGNSYVY